MFRMNKTIVLIAGAIGSYLTYKGVNNCLEKHALKREVEIRQIQSEWHTMGFNGGYDAGKQDAVYETMRKQSLNNEE
jgi:hypothetical protein